MILPLFGGAIIDRFGIRESISLFFFLNLLGNFVFSLGGVYESFTLMIVGRAIFGTGNFTSMTALTVIVTKWFISSNLNLAYGLMTISWGLSAMASAIFTPMLYGTEEDPHLGKALMAGFWINLICIVFLIPVLIIDYLADKEM
jgi:MFS family permease